MSLRLTPDMLAAAYDFLRATEPFRCWKLPEADDVGFAVIRDPKMFADFGVENGTPIIRVSEAKHGFTVTLLATMAHEMCHLRQELIGDRSHHGAKFKRMAAQVCRVHGFDLKTFSGSIRRSVENRARPADAVAMRPDETSGRAERVELAQIAPARCRVEIGHAITSACSQILHHMPVAAEKACDIGKGRRRQGQAGDGGQNLRTKDIHAPEHEAGNCAETGIDAGKVTARKP